MRPVGAGGGGRVGVGGGQDVGMLQSPERASWNKYFERRQGSPGRRNHRSKAEEWGIHTVEKRKLITIF